jgi:hypothetical protein
MSVGVHAGPVELFLVGDVHRELLVAGDATSQTVQAEAAAAAGEVLLSHEAAAGLDPRFLGPPRAEGVPLRAAPDPPRRPARRVDVTGVDLVDAIPVALRRAPAVRARDPEHRPVTVAFIEVSGTDEMLADAGPAALAIALHDLVSAVQRAALQQQVSCHESDIAANGVKLLLVGGAPDTTGTDEDRVLLAARAAIEHPGPLSVRVGINRGACSPASSGRPTGRRSPSRATR